VARYKKAKQFQYQINKEPDLLGPEGKNVPPKPAGSDPTKQMPASLRRMIAAQEKMKEIEGDAPSHLVAFIIPTIAKLIISKIFLAKN
jgi:hypothetical protein